MQTNLGNPGKDARPGTVPVPHFKIAVDDVTERWDSDIQQKCGQIWEVFLYDENRHVNLCELASLSLECWFLYTVTEKEPDEETQGILDWYDDITDPVTYFHVSGFSSRYDCSNDGWSMADYDSYEELLEAAIEYYKCNHVV